jgi:hypothetical protein
MYISAWWRWISRLWAHLRLIHTCASTSIAAAQLALHLPILDVVLLVLLFLVPKPLEDNPDLNGGRTDATEINFELQCDGKKRGRRGCQPRRQPTSSFITWSAV